MSLRNTTIRLENLANELRQELQIRFTAPVSIHQILKEKGIIGYFRPLQGLSGMAVKIARNEFTVPKLFMLVNTSEQYCKQRFTACHELYHLLYQEKFSVSYDDNIFQPVDSEERNANIFATFLLMPEAGIKYLTPVNEQRRNVIRLGTVLMLEQNFRCSHQAMLIRLRELGWITEDYMENLKGEVRRNAQEYGYDTRLYEPTNNTELVGDYNLKARELYDLNLISQAKYFSYLRDMDIYKSTD